MGILLYADKAVFLLLLITYAETGNVLFITSPVFSHLNRNIKLAADLAEHHGHKSTVLVNAASAKTMPKESYLDYIVAKSFKDFNNKRVGEQLSSHMCSPNVNFVMLKLLIEEMDIFCKSLFADRELIQTIKEKSFDIAIVDSNYKSGCFNILAHNLSLPRIQDGLPYHFVNWRIPFLPSVTFPIPSLDKGGDISFAQRLKNTLAAVVLVSLRDPFVPSDNYFTYSNEVTYKTLEELHATNELILVDSDPVLDFPKPLMPNVVEIGGLTTRKSEVLTEPLLSFMESSPGGVIVVSFGSFGWPLPAKTINILLSAFKQMSTLKFVFKHGNTIKYDQNIIMLPWLPQNDLLAHRNTKAFITHCGNNGQYEALYHAVPMIGVPTKGDQFHNADRIRAKGYGIVLDLCSLDEKKVVDSVNEILKREYKYAISNASAIFHGQPMEPSKRAAFWIDHVIRYGGQHLRPSYMPFYQYYLLDVIACLLLVGITGLVLGVLLCSKFYRICCYFRLKIKQD